MSGLTKFQIEVANSFMDLDSKNYFVLAGGGALLVHGISNRPTQDLDFFTTNPNFIIELGLNNLVTLAKQKSWTIETVVKSDSFLRVVVSGDESLVVDLARDSAMILEPVQTKIGLTLDPLELAGRKLLALYDRAAARDFVDIHALSLHFERDQMVSMALRIDAGFDLSVLAEMFRTIERFDSRDLETSDFSANQILQFFREWEKSIPRSNSFGEQ
jgi:hypothetical protein